MHPDQTSEKFEFVDSEWNGIPFLPLTLPKEPHFLIQHSASEEGPWVSLDFKCFTLIEAKCHALLTAEEKPFDYVRVLEKDKPVLKGGPLRERSFKESYRTLYNSTVYRLETAYADSDGCEEFRTDVASYTDEKEAVRRMEYHRRRFPSSKRRMRVETVTVYSDELLPIPPQN